MISSSASVSGIRAAFKMLDASAHNTANLNTDGFKKHAVLLSEANGGGVFAKESVTASAGPLYMSNGNIYEASNADYGEEAVNQIIARQMLSANIAALKTADSMQKSLLDLFA